MATRADTDPSVPVGLPLAVSVVVPTCNRAAQLGRCLAGLAGQTGCRFEVIVVDDGSRDGTPAVVAAAAAAYPDIPLVCLVNEQNLGANPSRNRGIRASRAPFVAFTDDDCVPESGWLENLLAGFSTPDVGAVTGLVLNEPARNLYERALRGTHRVAGSRTASRLVGGNMCVRREPLLAHMFDEDRAQTRHDAAGVPDMRVSGRGDEEGLYLALKAGGYAVRVAAAARVTHAHRHDRRSFFKLAYLGGRSAARLVYKFHLPPRLDLLPMLLAYMTLPVCLWDWRLVWLSGLLFAAALAAIIYNDLFRKRKTLAETLITFPLLLVYYHIRLYGYVRESLRLRLCRHDLKRQRLAPVKPAALATGTADTAGAAKRGITALLSMALTLLLLEAGFQVVDFPRYRHSGWQDPADALPVPEERNQLGFRGRTIAYDDKDFVVVLLGDSELRALGVPFADMPEQRLRYHLQRLGAERAQVFSIGTAGYGQDQQLLALSEYYRTYRADLVIAWFTARNDVVNNVFSTSRSGAPKPTYWLEGGKLRGPTEPWMGRVGPRLKLGQIWQRCFPVDRIGEWEKRLPRPYQPLPEYAGVANWEWQKIHDRLSSRRRLEYFDTEHITHALLLTPRSARTQYGLDLTRALLKGIEDLVHANGGTFLILKEDRSWEQSRNEAQKVYACDGKYLATSMAQYHENLDYLFRGFPVVRVALPEENSELSATDNHLNPAAIDFVFRRLAQQLPAPRALLQLRIAVDGDARKRGQEPKAGTALRVLRTFGS